MNKRKYIEINWDSVSQYNTKNIILIVTATDLETNALHETLKPINGLNNIIRVFEGDLTYYFGILGNYLVVHVQSSMGALSRDSSIMTVSTAIEKTKAKIVIMVGIAFGVDEVSQKIGDVLISESVIPYNTKRVGKKDTIQRGIEAPSSKILLNRFKNIKQSWEYFISDDIRGDLIPCRLLSGEELIDNLNHRNKLIKQNPDSKGGEMEGAGIYAACDGKAEWIIVKGICDFADGKKGKNKRERQTIAIKSAISVCMEVFVSNSAFKDLNVLPFTEENVENEIKREVLNDVLFDIYDQKKEQYYIERELDNKFNEIVSQYGVWIFGPVGCGKSNLILRNLINSKRDFIQISLAACIGLDVESFFKEIYFELVSNIEFIKSQSQPTSFKECSKAIIEVLIEYYKDRQIIIFIEEIPICTEADYQNFSSKLFSLLISKSLLNGLEKVIFILSSINNPSGHIQIFQQKIHQQLCFLPLEYWSNEEIIELISKIELELKFSLPKESKLKLIELAEGSPRFIKKFFRSLFTVNKFDTNSVQNILLETKRELNQYKNA